MKSLSGPGAIRLHPGTCLRVPAAADRLGVSITTLWRWVRERHDFPKPIKLGPRTTVWSSTDIDAFIERQREAA